MASGNPLEAGICSSLASAVAAPDASVQLTVVVPELNRPTEPVLVGIAVDEQDEPVAVQVL